MATGTKDAANDGLIGIFYLNTAYRPSFVPNSQIFERLGTKKYKLPEEHSDQYQYRNSPVYVPIIQKTGDICTPEDEKAFPNSPTIFDEIPSLIQSR